MEAEYTIFSLQMKFMAKTTVIICIAILSISFGDHRLNAQMRNAIDSLTTVEQSCLDSGGRMIDCSYRFYLQMDSILNTVYKCIRTNLNTGQAETLKKEQRLWLKKRTAYLRESNEEIKSDGIQGSDARMIIYDKDAKFIQDRIFALIKNWDYKKIYRN